MTSTAALVPSTYRLSYPIPGCMTISRSRVSALRRRYDPNTPSDESLKSAARSALSPRVYCRDSHTTHPSYKPLVKKFAKLPTNVNNRIANDFLMSVCDFLEIRDLGRFPTVCQSWYRGALASFNYQLIHSIGDTLRLRDAAYSAIKNCYYRKDGLFKYCILRWTEGGEIFSNEQNRHLRTLHSHIELGSMRPEKNQKNAQLMIASGAKTAAHAALVSAWKARNRSIELARSGRAPSSRIAPSAESFVDSCLRGKPLSPNPESNSLKPRWTWENYAAAALKLAWNHKGGIIAILVGAYFWGMRRV